jgi:hypothetical protein
MRKKLGDEFATKAKKREIKKRPRMNMHGASLKRDNSHAGRKITGK